MIDLQNLNKDVRDRDTETPNRMSSQPSPTPIKVLLLSRNRELGLLRQKVLELCGCNVTFPENQDETLEHLKHDWQVIVIAHTISRESADRYAEMFRKRNPEGRIVYVRGTMTEPAPRWADESVVGLAGPEEMVRAVVGGD